MKELILRLGVWFDELLFGPQKLEHPSHADDDEWEEEEDAQ